MARKEYLLTDDQYARINKASEPVPAMALSGGEPMFGTPQENANREWQRIAGEIGVQWHTIRPAPGKSDRYITAEPLPPPLDKDT